MRGGHGDGGEGFVDFKEIGVVDRPADFFEQPLDGADGGGGEPLRLGAKGGRADDAGYWVEAKFFASAIGRNNQGGGTVVNAGRVAGGDSTLRIEGRLETAEFCFVETGGFFIFTNERGSFSAWNGDGDNFVGEDAVGDGFSGALVTADCEVVLGCSRELIFCSAAFAVGAHVFVVVSVAEAVVDHGIDQHAVAKAIAGARVGEQVGSQAHVFHTAGDHDFCFA